MVLRTLAARCGKQPLKTKKSVLRDFVKAPPIFLNEMKDRLDRYNNVNPMPKPFSVLDMTFGVGSHAEAILEHYPESRVLAADMCPDSIDIASEMRDRHFGPERLTPLRSRFSQLPGRLRDSGFELKCFDVVILDSGCSPLQRNFANKSSPLDLRLDPDLMDKTPSASQVLQNVNEISLFKMLREYGDLKNQTKFVTNAIVEARYMFNTFQTIQDLDEVFCSAASRMALNTGAKESQLRKEMTEKTINALRMFVNNQLNELHFGLQVVAENFIKQNGLLFAIVRTPVESQILMSVLDEKSVPKEYTSEVKKIDYEQLRRLTLHPWTLENTDPIIVGKDELALNDKLCDARFYSAIRREHERPIW